MTLIVTVLGLELMISSGATVAGSTVGDDGGAIEGGIYYRIASNFWGEIFSWFML